MFNNIDIDTTEEDGSGSGRGAKGSLKDRIISILFRRRYEKFRLQREFYTKDNIDKKISYIKTIKDFDIDKVNRLDNEDKKVIRELDFIIPVFPINQKKLDIYVPDVSDTKININETVSDINEPSKEIQELHKLSDVIVNYEPVYELDGREIEVDPDTEVFDFDKYDYYEIEDIKAGIDIKNTKDDDKEIVNIEKEEKISKDEKVIVEEIDKFIDESQEIISEIKEEVKVIQDEVEKPYTLEQATLLEQKSDSVRHKIDDLKNKYDTIKEKYDFSEFAMEKYDFSEFAIIDSLEFMEAVDDYTDKAKLDTIEVMINVCKNEIDKIEGIVILKDQSVKVVTDIEDKKEEIIDRTIAFEKNKSETKKQERVEDQIAIELVEQRKILDDIKSRIDKIEIERIPEVRITGYGRMFASLLRVAAGIITVPLSNRRIFGIAMGAALINKYEDLEREIINCKDKLEYTNLMLIDSIEQVDKLKVEFHDKFEKYVYLIPEYKDAMNKLDNLKKKLEQKHIELKTIDKDLDLQRKRNNEKIKRLEKK